MFGFFENEQAKKIKGHLCNLAALAKADGNVDDRELKFIITVGQKNGVSASEVRKIVQSGTSDTADLPTNDSERFDQIFDLIDMMLADGIVDQTEMQFCTVMAEKLGFREDVVDVLMRKISQGVKDAVPRERIKDESLSWLKNGPLPQR